MLAALAAALLATTSVPSRSGEIHALVVRCLEAHGGPAAVARAARRQELGTVTSIMHPGETGHIGRAYERSGKLRVELQWPGGDGEIRVLDGGKGWRQGQEVGGGQLASMVLQAARLDLPALLGSMEERLVDRGVQTVDGRKLRVLVLELAPATFVEAGLDPATGRLLRSRGYTTGPAKVEFITTYEDHRLVDGVLVAMREVNWANGRTTGETVLAEVSFPAELPPGLFQP